MSAGLAESKNSPTQRSGVWRIRACATARAGGARLVTCGQAGQLQEQAGEDASRVELPWGRSGEAGPGPGRIRGEHLQPIDLVRAEGFGGRADLDGRRGAAGRGAGAQPGREGRCEEHGADEVSARSASSGSAPGVHLDHGAPRSSSVAPGAWGSREVGSRAAAGSRRDRDRVQSAYIGCSRALRSGYLRQSRSNSRRCSSWLRSRNRANSFRASSESPSVRASRLGSLGCMWVARHAVQVGERHRAFPGRCSGVSVCS